MNVFLAGGAGPFLDALIDKLNKNGHRVYLLTGKTTRGTASRRVFERYDFSYESDSIREVLAGVQPEVVLFLGAYDPNFDWQDPRRESVRFTASLMNLLSAYSLQEKGRFVYLSSQEVFADSSAGDITEETPTSAKDFRALTLVQGEEICANYQKQGMRCIIARLDHLYGMPVPEAPFPDPCAGMALRLLRGEPLHTSSRHTISMLHQNDAVEFLYRLLEKEAPEHSLYHLSSGEPITLFQIAEHLTEGSGTSPVQDAAGEAAYRQVLSAQRFQAEFNTRLFVSYPQGIQKEWSYLQKHKKAFLAGDAAASEAGGWRSTLRECIRLFVPYLETAVCIVPAYFLNRMAVQNTIFDGLDVYLLYELVIALVHGQQTAVFAAVLAAGGYLLQQSASAGAALGGLLDYKTYLWMAQLLIVGMAVGYLKDQIQEIRTDTDSEIRYLKNQLEEIESINSSNVRMKQMFEQQIVNQKDSLGKIYEITAELERRSPEEVLFYAARVLSELMNTQDAAVYTVANGDYARLFSFTSQRAKQLGSSICYTRMPAMHQDLQNQRVFVNRTLDAQYPLMACGIYTNGSLQLILMLWGLPWEKMNLAETNRLRVVSYLIQNAMLQARTYLDALQSRRYLSDTGILNEDAFRQLVEAFLNAKDEQLTECSLLEVQNVDPSAREDVQALRYNLRQSDYLGMLNDCLYILLCNTDDAGAQAVIDRLAQAGIRTQHGRRGSKTP